MRIRLPCGWSMHGHKRRCKRNWQDMTISLMKNIIAVLILVISVSTLGFVAAADTTETISNGKNMANRDFVAYWSAAQLFVRHINPYDRTTVLRVEQSVGYKHNQPMMMRNPPPALTLAFPLGFVDLQVGAALWYLLLGGCLMISIRLLWILNGRPNDRLHLVAYLFAPTVACMLTGQTSVFVLLGLTLFLYLRSTRPFLAGMCLALCAIKPHLLLPFGGVLLAWSWSRGSYRVLYGATAGLVCATSLPLALVPSVCTDYVAMLCQAGLDTEFIPTASSLFRIAIDRESAWVQSAPALFGLVWALWYFHRHRAEWDWNTHGLLLLLVSLLVAPYAWMTDEVIALPAILSATYLASKRSLVAFGLLNGLAVVGIAMGIPLATGAYIWTSAAWLLWYSNVLKFRCKLAVETVMRRVGYV
jgi:hypothetical protein